MRQMTSNNLFIDKLAIPRQRRFHTGVMKALPQISAAIVASASALKRQELIAGYVEVGEQAQAARSGATLAQVGRGILSLNLGRETDSIGVYYAALSLNRLGPSAYGQSNALLSEVADHAPQAFRAKARVAMATNLNILGDAKGALSLYTEAASIANRCQYGASHPLFNVHLQGAIICSADGDHRGSLASLRNMASLAHEVGKQLPALLHLYYNNLAVQLVANGHVEEARRASRILLASPFLSAYPEWQRTIVAVVDARTHRSRSPFVSVGAERCDATAPSNVLDFPSNSERMTASAQSAPDSVGGNGARLLKFRQRRSPVRASGCEQPLSRPDLAPNQVRTLSFQQKQALFLKLILSDDITEREIDQLLHFAHSMGSHREN
jgi:tetratricopeptide (TPR) repeat protein